MLMIGAVAGRVEVELQNQTKTLPTIPRNYADFQKIETLGITKTFSIRLKKKGCIKQNFCLSSGS